jgi:hypothetical protein
MSATTASCPNCGTLRAPNSQYCHVCGHAYDAGRSDLRQVRTDVPASVEIELSVTTGFKFGLGLALAVTLFAIVSAAVSLVLTGAMLRSLFPY